MTRFRTDINGLRAWAVLPVIFFHFGVPGFSGGFVGVDIFFVISGFLMTGIIVRYLSDAHADIAFHRSAQPFGAFLIGFWLARARRIIPALLILCAVLMALGWFWLPWPDYKKLSEQVVSALLFLSNIKFWQDTGYFDTASHEKWLLHTWSLSVEWQFYIVLPIIAPLFWRVMPGRKPLAWFMAAGLLASFALCVFATYWKPSAGFFLLPTRAWEMLTGGLLFLLPERSDWSAARRRLLEGAGLILIILAILLFDDKTPWPGWRTTIPVAGAALVLAAARQGSAWTGSRLAQRVGDSSYSLYLWHWPISVLLLYLGVHGELYPTLAALFVTAALGWASYRLIETPARKSLAPLKPLRAIATLAVALGLVSMASADVWMKSGVPGRLPTAVDRIAAGAEDKNPRRDECMGISNAWPKECTYGGPQLGVIVLGDSHAASVVRSVERSLPRADLHVLDWAQNSCPTIDGIMDAGLETGGEACGSFVHAAIARLNNVPARIPLLVVNRMNATMEGETENGELTPGKYLDRLQTSFNDSYRRQMRDAAILTLCKLAANRPVYVLRETPEMRKSVPATMRNAALFYGRAVRVSLPLADHMKRSRWAHSVQDMAAAQCGVKILDATPALCAAGSCYGDKNGVPLYYDDDHLSEHGAALLIPLFKTMFARPPASISPSTSGQPIARYAKRSQHRGESN